MTLSFPSFDTLSHTPRLRSLSTSLAPGTVGYFYHHEVALVGSPFRIAAAKTMFEKDCLRAPMALSAFDPAALGAFMGQTPAPAPPVPAPVAAAAVPAPAPAPVASALGAWGKEAPWARAPPPTLQSLGDKKGSAPAAAALPADDDDESLELAPAAGTAAAARPLNLSSDDDDDDDEEEDDDDSDDDDDSGDRDHAKGKTKVLGSGGGGASQPYTLERFEDSGHYLLVVNCPMDRAGLVIGYKGSTIRTIGAKAHARVTVSDVKVAAPFHALFPALLLPSRLPSVSSALPPHLPPAITAIRW